MEFQVCLLDISHGSSCAEYNIYQEGRKTGALKNVQQNEHAVLLGTCYKRGQPLHFEDFGIPWKITALFSVRRKKFTTEKNSPKKGVKSAKKTPNIDHFWKNVVQPSCFSRNHFRCIFEYSYFFTKLFLIKMKIGHFKNVQKCKTKPDFFLKVKFPIL